MLILTPIAKERKASGADSRRDYEEQLERSLEGGTWMWDDVAPSRGGNKASVGDQFGFVMNGVRVQLHTVTAVHDPSERLPSWAANVGQSDRQVLILSGVTKEYTWEEWLALGGHAKVLGTIYARLLTL